MQPSNTQAGPFGRACLCRATSAVEQAVSADPAVSGWALDRSFELLTFSLFTFLPGLRAQQTLVYSLSCCSRAAVQMPVLRLTTHQADSAGVQSLVSVQAGCLLTSAVWPCGVTANTQCLCLLVHV